MSVRQQRYCDVCGVDYSERPDWMILAAPNAPAEVEAEWDFCSYACLSQWVTTDEVDDAGPDFGTEHDTARAVGQVERAAEAELRGQAFHVEQPDGTPPPPAEVRRVHPGEPTREQAQAQAQVEAQAKLDAAMAEMRKSEDARPPMTLMEAIASGKLPFDRDPQ